MAEFNEVHIVSLENASRFFSGAPVKIYHIPVNFFMTIAKIFHNPSKVSYVVLSSKSALLCIIAIRVTVCSRQIMICLSVGTGLAETCYSNLTLKAKSESGEIWRAL